MPEARKPTTKQPNGFTVKVEQVIGEVRFAAVGEQTPIESAMGLIGRHISKENGGGSGNEYTFTFPGPDENQRIRVEVTT